jgi:hypothetical protein
MKRALRFVCLSCFGLFSFQSFSQPVNDSVRSLKNEISLSFGAPNFYLVQAEFMQFFTIPFIFLGFPPDSSIITGFGTPGISYLYYPNKKLGIGISCYYANVRYKSYTYQFQFKNDYYIAMADIKYRYVLKPIFTLYSGIGLGAVIINSNVEGEVSHSEVNTAARIDIIGIRIGDEHAGGFFELGYGANAIIQAGVNINF